MNTQSFLLYLATWAVVALTPGPAAMCVMAQSTRFGFRSSLAGVSGVQIGHIVFVVCIGLGVGKLLAADTTAFIVLRVVGATYLFYLGVRVILSTFRRQPLKETTPATRLPAQHSLFLQGLLIQLTNPKALLFFSALLPQFIDPHRSVPGQLIILLATTIAVDSVVMSSYAFFAQRGVQSFRASRWSIWLERVFGIALVLFGIRLLLFLK